MAETNAETMSPAEFVRHVIADYKVMVSAREPGVPVSETKEREYHWQIAAIAALETIVTWLEAAPVAWMVRGGRMFRDRVVLHEEAAREDAEKRQDGSVVVPLGFRPMEGPEPEYLDLPAFLFDPQRKLGLVNGAEEFSINRRDAMALINRISPTIHAAGCAVRSKSCSCGLEAAARLRSKIRQADGLLP